MAIVGYQAPGLLGRKLVECRLFVRILRERIAVKSELRTLEEFSANTGQEELLRFIEPMVSRSVHVFLTPGVLTPACIRAVAGV